MSVIHHTFGPFVDARYALASVKQWFAGAGAGEQLRGALERHFDRRAFLFGSGREALLALLRAMEIGPGEAVVLQGFTCAVLPNAIHASGATPIYADIDRATLNLNAASVQAVLTPQTRAVICQHTFGIPADTAALRTLCDEHRLLLIEDCAHIIPDDVTGVIGRHGDAVLLSFGRDKAISGVTGGAILVRDAALAQRLRTLEASAAPLPHRQRLRLHLYPLIYWKAKLLWPLHLGKPYLKLMRWLHLLPPILTTAERRGLQPPRLHRLPHSSASLAYSCLQQLTLINAHRRQLAALYQAAFPQALAASPAPQKVPLLLPNANALIAALKRHQIYLDDGWRGAVVNPPSSDQAQMGYTPGTCPVAETVARDVVSLPTHPTMSEREARRLIEMLKRHSSATLAP